MKNVSRETHYVLNKAIYSRTKNFFQFIYYFISIIIL